MRKHPDIRVDVQKMPNTAAHEKLLTAYAGDALPDVCQLGNTWLSEFDALNALEPLESYVCRVRHFLSTTIFQPSSIRIALQVRLVGIPWYVDTRLLFYRTDMLKEAGFDAPPTLGSEWTEQLAAIKAMVGPRRYSILLPINEFDQLVSSALQQPSACFATTIGSAISAAPIFDVRSRSITRCLCASGRRE